MIFPSAVIPVHATCHARSTCGNGLFWLGKDCDVQVPRAVHLGSQVSVAAASGVCAATLTGLPARLFPSLPRCELD